MVQRNPVMQRLRISKQRFRHRCAQVQEQASPRHRDNSWLRNCQCESLLMHAFLRPEPPLLYDQGLDPLHQKIHRIGG